MATRSFTHLHTHTEFSMLDGAARIADLVQAAVEDGQPALGITDHGNMYGVLDFYAACREAGINPVIGTEAYMAAESRHDRPVRRGKVDDTGGDVEGGDKLYYHLTLLAETTAGYRNLLKLSSAAYLEGYYYKPRVDWELLERHHDGLIATTGCLGGVVLQALLADDHVKAEHLAARLQDIFGKDHFFVELQDHGIAAQHKTNPALVEIARRIGAPLLATNDSHYTHREDHVVQDALLCVQTGALIDDPKRFKFEGEEHYLKSAAEMRALFGEIPEACDNTLLIAERANVEIDFRRVSLPKFPVPDEFVGENYEDRAAQYLRHLSIEGAKERYGHPIPAPVLERLDYELGVIGSMGFSAYFLVVWDLIRFARSHGIRVGPGRGSAAGCCVAYCLQIVDLDPIKYDLLFERFLNPGRTQMPDIDMDFDERYRGDMIRYASDRYGADHVAQIVTFSTIKARAAVRDGARVLGYPYIVGDKIAKAMPPLLMGRDTPLAACLDRTEGYEDGYAAAGELRAMYESDAEAKKVIDVAKGLEGLRRQDGIHAAAVVITDEPLTEYVPIQRKPDGSSDPTNAPVVTQYEMHGVEDPGPVEDGLPRPAEPVGDRAGPRPHPDLDRRATRHRQHPPGRRNHLRHAAQGRLHGGVPARGRPDAIPHALARPHQLRRRGRPGGAVPTGSDGGQHAQGLRRPEERPEAHHLRAPGPGTDSGRHPGPDDLSGVRDAGGPEVRRLLARGGGQPPQGLREEDPVGHGHRAAEVRRRMREPGLWRVDRHHPLRHHRALRRLRLQQVPLIRLRPDRLPDGVAQGPPSDRVHGGVADVGQGQQGQDGHLPGRVPVDGHPGPGAQREPLALRLRRRLHRR